MTRRHATVPVVPTANTRKVAKAMLDTASKSTGPDAVVRHLTALEPGQLPALLGVVLNTARVTRKPGRPPMPNQLSEADARKGYSQYRQGIRSDFAVQGYRQYQRTSAQRRRRELQDPPRNLRAPAWDERTSA